MTLLLRVTDSCLFCFKKGVFFIFCSNSQDRFWIFLRFLQAARRHSQTFMSKVEQRILLVLDTVKQQPHLNPVCLERLLPWIKPFECNIQCCTQSTFSFRYSSFLHITFVLFSQYTAIKTIEIFCIINLSRNCQFFKTPPMQAFNLSKLYKCNGNFQLSQDTVHLPQTFLSCYKTQHCITF